MKKILLFYMVLFSFISVAFGQMPRRYDAADIRIMLEKLQVLGNVLYVAAHPDDENTRLITYFSNEVKVNTGYFSFTRGDGGQNLIGPEIREMLGVIRTQELLAARRIDHGRQFFSRAVDFGYSKHPDETFNIWDREKVLSDLVWVIRTFRPDVIIDRFNNTPGTTHGHHTASALLAEEAFSVAGNPQRFPEQLKYTTPWQPASIYWNTYSWRRDGNEKDTSELVSYDIGRYNPVLGKSYSEIAAESRSMHKSQGFGSSGSRGHTYDYLQYIDGLRGEKDAFEAIDITWNRVKGGGKMIPVIKKILSEYDMANPAAIVPDLLNLRKSISALDDEFWRGIKLREIDELIYACAGLFLEVSAVAQVAAPGDAVNLNVEAINRSNIPMVMTKLEMGHHLKDSVLSVSMLNNVRREFELRIKLPADIEYSQPYWLMNTGSMGMFRVDDQRLIGSPENGPALSCIFTIELGGSSITYEMPVIYKENDRVKGEVYRPFVIAPPVFANLNEPVYIFSKGSDKEIAIKVKAGVDDVQGVLKLDLPADWKVTPAGMPFAIAKANEEMLLNFKITSPPIESAVEGKAVVKVDGLDYTKSILSIEYDHIPNQKLFPEAISKFVSLDIRRDGERIGYLMGAGDEVPASLRQIGYQVEMINDLDFNPETLDQFDAIIMGVRSLNTVDRLKHDMDELLSYAKRGGNLIMQYNTSYGMLTQDFAPFSLTLSHDRVTVEEAEIRILDPNHAILNFPNKISGKDFNGWVQERGLYFPSAWDNAYQTVISCNDPGEQPLDGGLLVAPYGKGNFIYTSYSWFRELPAGVPGAYRIFANMISLQGGR